MLPDICKEKDLDFYSVLIVVMSGVTEITTVLMLITAHKFWNSSLR